MTQEKQPQINKQHGNVGAYQNDEIDLRELIKVAWSYKWLTVIMCAIAIVGSVFYALNAQERWIAKGKILKPRLNDVATLYSQSKKVDTVLNSSKSKKNKDELVSLFDPKTLFRIFTNSFNSPLNKQKFLEANSVFIDYLATKEIVVPSEDITAENKLLRVAYRQALNSWMKEITISIDKKSGEATLSLSTPEKKLSAQVLNEYIVFINEKVKDNQFKKFIFLVDSSKQELSFSIEMAKKRVEEKLARMLKKTEYAYQIASQSGIIDYQETLSVDFFPIHLGKKALKVKIEVLKSITDLSFLDSRIFEKQITLDSLNQLQFVDDRSFTPFRYLEIVEPPLSRAAPKRALIVILATLLAGMLSIFIALVHHFMTKKESD